MSDGPPHNIQQIMDDFSAGKKVKVPYFKGMGPTYARAYYHQQHEIWCAIIGHRISGILEADCRAVCFRCDGKFRMDQIPCGLYEFLILLPIWKIKLWFRNRL